MRTHVSFRRSFPPGSEWVYDKLYTGSATADEVLRDLVRPLVKSVMSSGAADRWFFIRYGDPDWRLRLRFHGQPARLHDEVLPARQAGAKPLLDEGRLWRIQLDTYERGVERYGGAEGIVLAERIFTADSEAFPALADALVGDARGDVRWRLALLGMHCLLNDLNFDLEARRSILGKTRDAFAAEFRADANFKHELGRKFRLVRKNLERALELTADSDAQLAPVRKILRRQSRRITPVADELKMREQTGRLSMRLTELAPSFLHMHANRLLRSAHRAQELVIYDFLARLYNFQVAQGFERPRTV